MESKSFLAFSAPTKRDIEWGGTEVGGDGDIPYSRARHTGAYDSTTVTHGTSQMAETGTTISTPSVTYSIVDNGTSDSSTTSDGNSITGDDTSTTTSSSQ